MRLYTGVSRAEFAFFAGRRATSRAIDSLYLFESRLLSRLLGLHVVDDAAIRRRKTVNFA